MIELYNEKTSYNKDGITIDYKIKLDKENIGLVSVSIKEDFIELDIFQIYEDFRGFGFGSQSLQSLKLLLNKLSDEYYIEKILIRATPCENPTLSLSPLTSFYQKYLEVSVLSNLEDTNVLSGTLPINI